MIDLEIDRLTIGGRGVGRHEGKAVFVPFVLPGERVRCRIERTHKRYDEAVPVEILSAAPQRIVPSCPVFAECGGCQWQHIPYPEQLRQKQQLFRDAFAALPVDAGSFETIKPSPQDWNYRCRAQFKCRRTDSGFVAGFYRRGSHYVVDIDRCPLLDDRLNDLFASLKAIFAGYAQSDRVPQLDLCIDDDGQRSLIVHFLGDDPSTLRRLLDPLATEDSGQCAVHLQQGRKETLSTLFPQPSQSIRPLDASDMRLQFPPGGFVQVNLGQNRNLVDTVMTRVEDGIRVLDLFCGIGNFALPLAQKCAAVVGVEDYAPAIRYARDNAARLVLDNVSFATGDLGHGVQRYWKEDYDTVVLDPPRSGAMNVAKDLARLRPAQIIYVSCDPMTLVRDLKPLLHAGYTVRSCKAFDMFPQTAHIEGMVDLRL